MRFCALLLLLASSLAAQTEFLTGQGARLVIGQETFTAMKPGVSNRLLGAAGGVAYANNTLFVADANRLAAGPVNHRVLIYKNLSQQLPEPTAELVQGSRCPVCVGVADVVLGQPDFETGTQEAPAADRMRTPLGVHSDGVRLAVADTDNNRVLIWNSIPNLNGQSADLVLGQDSFDTNPSNGFNPTASTLKGPQGVWWVNGNLWVADTGNNRILMFRDPSRNGQAADLVLGAPDFTTFVQPDLTQQDFTATARTMQTPVSVSSDGQRLYVTDLGNSRVLIWNAIPSVNEQAADVAVGQANLEGREPNNSDEVCEAAEPVDTDLDGDIDEDDVPIYPTRCAATLDFPRFAVSDGQRLFIADGGNDRILVFRQVPTTSGAHADAVIGQVNEFVNNTSDSAFPDDIASAGVVRTPTSLAWDGRDLYVADPFNRRILVFTLSERLIAATGVRNAASFEVFAQGSVTITGSTRDNDDNFVADQTVSITVGETENEEGETVPDRVYTYEVQEDDSLFDLVFELADAVNAGDGDPEVVAIANPGFLSVILTSRIAGEVGNDVIYGSDTSDGSPLTLTNGGTSLSGGEEASKIAPYSIVSIVGDGLAVETASADMSGDRLPTELGGVQVYLDGIRSPIYYVSPTQINAQMPVEVFDTQGVSAYIRTTRADGTVVASNAIAVPIIPFNPGIFAEDGIDPRPAIAVHASSSATGVVSVDGTLGVGNEASIIINGRRYSYTVTQEDRDSGVDLCSVSEDAPDEQKEDPTCLDRTQFQLSIVKNALIDLINANDPEVRAFSSSQFQRIILQARVEGPQGNGLEYDADVSENSTVILTQTTTEFCCANQAGAVITESNPALPGEIIQVWATGLGLVEPESDRVLQQTGVRYQGSNANTPVEFVSSLAGGRTANVLSCGIEPGTFGLYRCDLQLNQGLPSNPLTVLTIAQGFQVSNIVTIAVLDPAPQEE